jgi:hypothetical protein
MRNIIYTHKSSSSFMISDQFLVTVKINKQHKLENMCGLEFDSVIDYESYYRLYYRRGQTTNHRLYRLIVLPLVQLAHFQLLFICKSNV